MILFFPPATLSLTLVLSLSSALDLGISQLISTFTHHLICINLNFQSLNIFKWELPLTFSVFGFWGHYLEAASYWSVLQETGGTAEGEPINYALIGSFIKLVSSYILESGPPLFDNFSKHPGPGPHIVTVVQGRNLTLKCSVTGISQHNTVSLDIDAKSLVPSISFTLLSDNTKPADIYLSTI